jgi:hypothetical protein
MTKLCIYSLMKRLIVRLHCLLIVVFIPLALAGQKPVDFSGTWVQDNSKGNDILKGINLTLSITQTDKTITIKEIFFNDEGKEEDSRQSSYSLDGKEVIQKEGQWVTRKSATWSTDKKEITVKTTQTVETQVIEAFEIYSLSESGLILTLKRYNVQAKDHMYISVFNKKK